MKFRLMTVLLAGSLTMILNGCGPNLPYGPQQSGFDQGYGDAGFDQGYGDQYDSGLNNQFDQGYGDQFNSGLNNQFDQGFDDPYNSGLNNQFDQGYGDQFNSGLNNQFGQGGPGYGQNFNSPSRNYGGYQSNPNYIDPSATYNRGQNFNSFSPPNTYYNNSPQPLRTNNSSNKPTNNYNFSMFNNVKSEKKEAPKAKPVAQKRNLRGVTVTRFTGKVTRELITVNGQLSEAQETKGLQELIQSKANDGVWLEIKLSRHIRKVKTDKFGKFNARFDKHGLKPGKYKVSISIADLNNKAVSLTAAPVEKKVTIK